MGSPGGGIAIPSWRCAAVAVAIGMAGLIVTGCAGAQQPVADGGDRHPTPLRIELTVAEQESGRRVGYRLEPDGGLHFAGGRRLLHGEWRESGRLSLEQRAALWQVIDRHDLLDADNVLFASADEVRYDVKLRAGDRRAAFVSVDDRAEGLAELSEALGELHAELSAEEVYRPIEGAIRRSGGDGPRQ